MVRLKNVLHFLQVYLNAKKGDPVSMYELSSFYLFGIFVREDHQKAYSLLEKAKSQGLKEAQMAIDTEFQIENGQVELSKNFSNIFPKLKEARIMAEKKGDREALFFWGVGKVEDESSTQLQYEIGLRYIRLAAELGHPEALFTLGAQYMQGRRMPQNMDEGLRLIRQSADYGCMRAIKFLIKFYLHLKDEKADEAAFLYIQKAAQLNDVESTGLLAECYMEGRLTGKNIPKGLKLMQKAAEMGDVDSLYNLGVIYHRGRYGLDVDIDKAIYWYEKAIEKNDAQSMTNLAAILQKSIEAADKERAFQLYQKAFELGDEKSLNNIGVCYKKGIGTEKNPEKAIECYEQAYAKGIKEAAYNLYQFYSDGEAVTPDPQKAAYWKERS